MTLQQILNVTTAGGAIVAVALVVAAWARARSEFRTAPSAASMPRLPARRRGVAADSNLLLTEPENVGLRIIEPRGPAGTAPQAPALAEHAGAGDTAELTRETTEPVTAPPRREIALTDHVTAGPAWTSSDSWLTSTTALGSGLLAVVNLGIDGTSAGWLLAMYALSAALAPVIYGCLAPASAAGVRGSIRGFLLASLATLFGGIGLIATIWGVGASSIHAAAVDVVVGVACALLIIAVSGYGFRTIVGVLVTQATTPTGEPIRPTGHGVATPSLLLGSRGRRSATL